MSKVITSVALEPLNKALGLAGAGDSQTELMDGTVDQVIDVGQISRRGGTLAGTGGVFRCVLRNIHTTSETVSSSWQPYLPAAAGVNAPYPSPVSDNFDVYLIGASLQRSSGAASMSVGALSLTNVLQGFGIDSAGAGIVSTSVFTIATWDDIITAMSPNFARTVKRLPYKTIGLRIPRKGAIASPFLSFTTVSGGATAGEFDCIMLMGIFPVALGQDIAV